MKIDKTLASVGASVVVLVGLGLAGGLALAHSGSPAPAKAPAVQLVQQAGDVTSTSAAAPSAASVAPVASPAAAIPAKLPAPRVSSSKASHSVVVRKKAAVVTDQQPVDVPATDAPPVSDAPAPDPSTSASSDAPSAPAMGPGSHSMPNQAPSCFSGNTVTGFGTCTPASPGAN